MKKNNRQEVSDSAIRSAARKSTSISQTASEAGYSPSSNVGSNTSFRIKLAIGDDCYAEIASGMRKKMKKSQWTKPSVKRS